MTVFVVKGDSFFCKSSMLASRLILEHFKLLRTTIDKKKPGALLYQFLMSEELRLYLEEYWNCQVKWLHH